MIPFYLLNCLGLVIVFDAGDAHPFASVLLAISFLVSLTCFTYAVFSRSLSATSFAYLLYATYGFILAGLMQVRSDRFYWINNAVQREYIPDAAVIVLLSTLAFALGYFCRVASRPTPIERPLTEVPQGQRNRIARATFVVCLLTFAYLLMAIATYGIAAFIGTRHTTGIALLASGGSTATYGLVFTLTRGMAIASMVIAGYVLLRMRIRNNWTLAAMVLACLTLCIANFPPALPRFWLIATILAVLMSTAKGWFLRWKTALFAAAPLLMFGLFPALQAYNRRSESVNLNVSFTSPLEGMMHGDYDGVQAMVNVFGMVSQEGVTLGSRLLSALLFFVPRSIWGGKHEPTGSEAAEIAGFNFLNISAPVPGELFADFHYVGAIGGMVLFGWLIRALDDGYDEARRPVISMMAVILAGFAPIIGRGPLLGVIAAPASALFLVGLWWGLSRIVLARQPRAASRARPRHGPTRPADRHL
ncbi:hypothetical protein Q4543_15855 [Salipiger sp. 1_MG-2023]|uniref:hypothetical protein n=1 Tax=Salipiger sp. 1_MG-2023 TaxID=3062665 RepID=UPI0026E260F2|nr:hypothetical protein [Salipiger sp. 1_MG-2023]MDO6586988.1 hypothetical protein [Salipiger sp. 1_MG-2023]